uniref:DUF3444 domain-containing protein n=1 Tax=Rodentolepis nana TaxID=102285 RepID=A0A0R3TZF6_RODNA
LHSSFPHHPRNSAKSGEMVGGHSRMKNGRADGSLQVHLVLDDQEMCSQWDSHSQPSEEQKLGLKDFASHDVYGVYVDFSSSRVHPIQNQVADRHQRKELRNGYLVASFHA